MLFSKTSPKSMLSAAEIAEVLQHRISPLVSNGHHITCFLLIRDVYGDTQVIRIYLRDPSGPLDTLSIVF
jgi:hypothetical protein